MRTQRIPFYLLIVGLGGLLSSAAVASHKKSETLSLLDDARTEAQALENIISDSAPRRIERRLMRRLSRLEDILDSLEGELISQQRQGRVVLESCRPCDSTRRRLPNLRFLSNHLR